MVAMMRGRKRGALLLETLLGLGIFATALLLSFGAFPNGQKATNLSRNYLLARSLARDYLDRELLKDFGSVVDIAPFPAPRTVTSNGVTTTVDFEVEIIVDVLDPGPPIARNNVRSVVRWAEGPFQREVFYESWIAQ